MKKKILGIFIVSVLLVLLFFVGSAVILFLAPGTEIFGVRYIKGSIGSVSEVKAISENEGDSVYINTHGVPITINYTNFYSSKVEFEQNFIGFTKSEFDKASIKVTTDENKNVHIETQELVKWVYSNEDKNNCKLIVNLSSVYFMNKNLYIVSNESSVTINGSATYKDVSIKTSNELIVEGSITANNFTFHTSRKINVNDKINAINYDVSSTGSSISFAKPVEGDIKATTKGGDVKFVSCYNLNVHTGGGSVKSYGEGLNTVKREAVVRARGGDVYLGTVSAEAPDVLCDIQTTSGDVFVNQMVCGSVSSDRGKVEIGNGKNVKVSTKVGNVVVNNISEEISVDGRNGHVTLGDGGQVKNVNVKTTTGRINVLNASGVINLNSEYNTVELQVIDSENITINAGRGVTAYGLKGKVDVEANGDINLNFANITNSVTIKSGTKTNEINVNAENTTYLDVDYNIVSTKGKKAKILVDGEVMAENANLNSGVHEGKKLITIETSYAVTVVKLGA